MTHILFSIRAFIVAFAVLASSLIIRPMLADPAPVKVDVTEAAAAVDTATPMSFDALIAQSDVIFVGRFAERPQLKANTAYEDYALAEVLVPLKGNVAQASRLELSFGQTADHEALYLTYSTRNREAIFFLQSRDGIYMPTEGSSGLVAIDRDTLVFSEAFTRLTDVPGEYHDSAKTLAEFILVSNR